MIASAEAHNDIDTEQSRSLVNRIGTHPFTKRVIRRIAPFLIGSAIDMVNFNLDQVSQVEQHLSKSSLLLLVSNHQSHADLTVITRVVQEFRGRFPNIGNFYIPLSATLENGRQDGFGQTFHWEIAVPTFKQSSINPFYVITDNDIRKRGMKLTYTQAKLQLEKIKEATAEKKSAFFALVEGTVEGGRHDEEGKVKGMQEVVSPFLHRVLRYAQENNREVICVPIGISGTYRILSGEHIFLTFESAVALVARLFRRRIILADATIGTPFVLNPEIDPNELNDIVMRYHVAPLVTETERGFYH